MSLLVDYFPYFAPYGDELLELRVNLLQDSVDYFVIAESNKTHSGSTVPWHFETAADMLSLPMHKIIYIRHEIPDDDDLEIQDIDRYNTYPNQWHSQQHLLDCQRARTRERLQKDALQLVLDQFPDDTVFVHSDYDEIINPRENLQYLANCARQRPDRIYKIPLVLLEARADLRVHDKNTGAPVPWDRSMFLATKKQLKSLTPTQIRSENHMPLELHHITENGRRVEDLGWHFSWMGGAAKRKIKTQSYAHYSDSFAWTQHLFSSFQDPRYHAWNDRYQFDENGMAPGGNQDHVLRPYAWDKLPDVMTKNPRLRKFFLDR